MAFGHGRRKGTEWVRRYLPLELAGWVGELGGAATGYWCTGSLATAAVAATLGGLVAYYVPAYVCAVRCSLRHPGRSARRVVPHLLAARSLAVEFGPAELIDGLLIRPALIYATPALLGDVLLGWIAGGFVADVAFYVVAICSYEKFKGLFVCRPLAEEVSSGPVPSVAVA